jgi:hypothetical protein
MGWADVIDATRMSVVSTDQTISLSVGQYVTMRLEAPPADSLPATRVHLENEWRGGSQPSRATNTVFRVTGYSDVVRISEEDTGRKLIDLGTAKYERASDVFDNP